MVDTSILSRNVLSKRHFFIYSLPRSGSAWLSQFLSQPGSFCYHEPRADWPDGFLERLENRPEPCVGAVDTSAYQVNIGFPNNFNLFVLQRLPSEIKRSSEEAGFKMDWAVEISKFNSRTSRLKVIYYHLLSDIGYLRELWEEIVGPGFDRERTEYLIEMNIQRSMSSIVNRLRMRL